MTRRQKELRIRSRGLGDYVRCVQLSGVLIAGCLFMPGCSGGEDPGESGSGGSTSTTATNPTDDTPNGDHQTADQVAVIPTDTQSTEPMTPIIQESEKTSRAREVFASLMTPLTPEEWDAAQLELEQLGEDATPVLIKALESNNLVEREMAAQELVILVLDVSDYREQLLAALNDDSVQVRGVCAVALLTQSPESADRVMAALIDVLGTGDASLREMASVNLRTFPEVVIAELPQVIEALRDAPPKVALPLIAALEAAGPQAADASDVLHELAEGDNAEIAAAARQALATIDGTTE